MGDSGWTLMCDLPDSVPTEVATAAVATLPPGDSSSTLGGDIQASFSVAAN